MYAVRDEHSAMDIVQDAMLKLTERYADKPAEELPPIFQRILQNTVHDHFRRQKVRSTWTTRRETAATACVLLPRAVVVADAML